MANEKYFYKRYWDGIYNGNLHDMPWIGECEKAPFIKSFFDNKENKNKFKNAKILDVGCGDGSLCEYLSELGYEKITGIDVSEVIISKCREKKNPKVKYIRKDIVNEHFDSIEKYDIIICWFLLHHIKNEDVEKFIIKLFNLCNPNGILILSSLYNDEMESRDSYFSSIHKVIYYTDKKVKDLFSPYFRDNKIAKCELYEMPDENNEKYPYCAVELVRNELKSVLDSKINNFKESSKEAQPEELQNLTEKLIALLNEFSFYTNFTNELNEEDISHLFDRLFRNVSRFLCKRIENKKGNDKENKDVIILKLDSFLNDSNGGRIFTATMYDEEGDIQIRFNEHVNKEVKSRAYNLFLEYSKYLKTEKLSEDQQYSLHKHFADNPNLPFIVFDIDKIDNHKLLKDICGYDNYYIFLKSLFNNFEQDDTEKKDETEKKDDTEKKGFLKYLYNQNRSPKDNFGDVATSFLCFNLGVLGFESWGTLMIESKEIWNTILELFYEVENAENDKNNNGDEYAYKKETELLRNIKDVIFILKKIDYDCYKMLSDRKLKKEAIKSAIAALMARNMSHNLGSHYLTNTKNYFNRQIKKLEQQQMFNGILPDYRGSVAMLQYIQERMDFIATLVSFDKYPFGSLNFKSQFFDILTEDDHGARHGKETQNFLLKYLVFSENLTRGDNLEKNYHHLKLKVQYQENSEHDVYIFNGNSKEKKAKLKLSKLNLAIPGGLMARHALFTIVENIIRNSAKHSQSEKDLEITIDLKLEKEKVAISIFDNRQNVEGYKDVKDNYNKLRIIDENSITDKNSKGLKEILICVLWLQNKDVTDILYDIQNTEEKEYKRFNKIFEHLRIENENETIRYSFDLPIFTPFFVLKESEHYVLEVKEQKQILSFINSKEVLTMLHADIVKAKEDYFIVNDSDREGKKYKEIFRERKLSDLFPRFLVNDSTSDNEESLLRIIKPDYFKKNIAVNCTRYGEGSILDGDKKVVATVSELENYDIYFYDHLDDKPLLEKIQILEKGKYVESVSGENFTSTIATKKFLEDPVLRYKTVEAAMSRIIIIDERIFGDLKKRQDAIVQPKRLEWWDDKKGFNELYNLLYYDHWDDVSDETKNCVKDLKNSEDSSEEKKRKLKELLCAASEEYSKLTDEQKEKANRIEQLMLEARNIFIYDFDNEMEGFVDLSNHIEGISDKHKDKEDSESFLSIHLGLIEKYYKDKYNKDKDFLGALNQCMAKIRETFNVKYIAIHSGRGNFSADLSEGLSYYPFISLSALEAAFYNCKYFLSELFHNINYYGKGCLNN